MPRAAVEDNERMSLRIAASAKSKLLRAAALSNTDLTHFVTQSALRAAEAVIAEAEAVETSEQDYRRIVDLLENPQKPNPRLRAAIAALPDTL